MSQHWTCAKCDQPILKGQPCTTATTVSGSPMALPISRLTRLRRILEEAKAFRHGKANGEQYDQTRRHLLMRTHPRLCLTYCV